MCDLKLHLNTSMVTPLASGTCISDLPILQRWAPRRIQIEISGHPLLLRDLLPQTLKAGEGWSHLEVKVAGIQTDFSFPTDNMLFRFPKNWLKAGWKGRSEGQGEWTSCTRNWEGAFHWASIDQEAKWRTDSPGLHMLWEGLLLPSGTPRAEVTCPPRHCKVHYL
uniref:Uncharacterized protein n=1 Tax=Pipistrellus kuhlii TaxID=59472 RepID=A0A7J7RRG7_PIPKU|nr:hypothetical protein mPipKuh1_010379 [Pipistrellus kuhlii]